MITVALIDDETLVANSLATLIGLEADISVVHVSYSPAEFTQWFAAAGTLPDVVVTDLQLDARGGRRENAQVERIDGVEVARRVLAQSPSTGVVIVTSHARPVVLRNALAAGVLGVLPKTASAQDFAAAIRDAHAGRRHIDPDLAAATISAGDSPLTAREAEVLTLTGNGSSIDDIAAAAHLAPGTTRNYISSAIAKTGTANRFEAFTVARDRGWI